MAADNKVLGSFDLTGIPAAPRGVPQIDVAFDIDADGLVSVTAKDKASGKEQQIRIEANGGLSDADIDGMVRDAEKNAGADKTRRAFVEMKNHADATIDRLEKVRSSMPAFSPRKTRRPPWRRSRAPGRRWLASAKIS